MRIHRISGLIAAATSVVALGGCSSAHPSASANTATAQSSTSFTMPSEVGQGLQDAQDDLQRVSGNPVYYSKSHDLLGSRHQILDRDWQVCSQNLAAGATVTESETVDFGVVKTNESCP